MRYDYESSLDLGLELMNLGSDNLLDGGFWLWEVGSEIEFYSDNFIKNLGFKNEEDFPHLASSWQAQIVPEDLVIALENYRNHVDSGGEIPYEQDALYNKKNGEQTEVHCSGILLIDAKNGKKLLIGSHKIIKDGRIS